MIVGNDNRGVKNLGFRADLQALHEEARDHLAGVGSVSGLYDVPLKERLFYQPKYELQKGREDFMDCATRGPINKYETQFEYAYKNGLMKPENKKWFEDIGFVVNGKPEFSDRFIAIKSNTTRTGNSLKAPIDATHRYGLIPKKMLPAEEWMTWEDYHDWSKITKEMENIGQEFLKRWSLNYEKLNPNTDREAQNKWELVLALFAWGLPVSGIYLRNDNDFNHVVKGVKRDTIIFDNYPDTYDGDALKNLAPDYKFYDTAYRLYVSAERLVPTKKKSWIDLFLEFLVSVAPLSHPSPPKPLPPKKETNLEKLHQEVLLWVGKDASPKDLVSDDVGCAESATNIIQQVFPNFRVPIFSTKDMGEELDRRSDLFKRTKIFKPGTVICSPRNDTTNGHVGFFTEKGVIISNDSKTGKMLKNYTVDSWIKEMREKRKLPIYFWEPLG